MKPNRQIQDPWCHGTGYNSKRKKETEEGGRERKKYILVTRESETMYQNMFKSFFAMYGGPCCNPSTQEYTQEDH
jgi:hypothetical protein